jgi:hypothetical protein
MGPANLVEHADQGPAILRKMAHLLLDKIKGCRCSNILYC